MRKIKLWFAFLVVLLVAAPLQGGVSRAEDTYTLQYITSATGSTTNYLSYLQGISGFNVSYFEDTALVNVGFNNVDISDVYNRNIGIGNFRNQGSVALLNIEPNLQVAPVTFVGQMFSQGNHVTAGDFNYAVIMNLNGFRGSGSWSWI
jgi:hypothetical protein